ncbi:hypothetical protein [Candidatus Formimonas warabiya]|uniref:hypothetical protein n=1 Tax=Formimonas warabiya TaxID=1761012 RepID=UPI001BE3FC61|nr:hypothetical protein [Candidatus Formimonas warabiya]
MEKNSLDPDSHSGLSGQCNRNNWWAFHNDNRDLRFTAVSLIILFPSSSSD